MSTKLKVKYDWGPLCNFLCEAFGAHKFSGTDRAVLDVVLRLTYGEPDWKRPGHRKESAKISQEEFLRRTGRSRSLVQNSLKSLKNSNVLIVISPPVGKTAAEYGINTRIDDWKTPRWGQIDCTDYPGHGALPTGPHGTDKTGPLEAQNRAPRELKQGPLEHKTGPLAASEPYSHKAADHPTEYKSKSKSKRSPIVPKGTEPVFEIKTPAEALSKKGLKTPEAMIAAEGRFTKRFARGFSNRERSELAEAYFAASPDPRLLLAAWLAAIEPAYEDRRDRKRDPERARYVSNSPFRDVYTMAAEAYADYLADHQDRPERLTAA